MNLLSRLRRAFRVAKGIGPGLITVLRRGGLGQLVAKLSGSRELVRLNLFLASKELALTDRARSERVARGVIGYRLLNDLDFEFLPWVPYRGTGLERLREVLADGRGALVCSQHFGAYRRFYYEMVRLGFDVVLVADDRVASTLKNSTADHLAYRGVDPDTIEEHLSRFEVVDAKKAGTVQHLFRALDANKIVLLYLDGNTGVSAPGQSGEAVDTRYSNTETVRFLGHDMAIRRGLTQIAYRKNIPIVPLFCGWTEDLEPTYEFLPPIAIDRTVDRDTFCRRTLQSLFDLFAQRVVRAPEQFEHWIYLHRWLIPSAPLAERVITDARRRLERAVAAGGRPKWRSERGRLFELGGKAMLVEAREGRLLAARGPIGTVVRHLESGRRGRASGSLDLLTRKSGVSADTLTDILIRFEAFGLLEWDLPKVAEASALALGSTGSD